jgi:hypothetical protein
MEEARSILRDAVETAVYAHYMLSDPKLQKIWLNKDDGPKEAKDFHEAFEKDKKAKLFKDLPELYEQWGRLSETGAHSTPQALASRFHVTELEKDIHYHLNYTGVEDRSWEPETFTMLLTVSNARTTCVSKLRKQIETGCGPRRKSRISGSDERETTSAHRHEI